MHSEENADTLNVGARSIICHFNPQQQQYKSQLAEGGTKEGIASSISFIPTSSRWYLFITKESFAARWLGQYRLATEIQREDPKFMLEANVNV